MLGSALKSKCWLPWPSSGGQLLSHFDVPVNKAAHAYNKGKVHHEYCFLMFAIFHWKLTVVGIAILSPKINLNIKKIRRFFIA